jgi:hypothetical protein
LKKDFDVAENSMAQIAKNSAREAALERRKASYAGGKAGLEKLGASQDRTRTGSGTGSTAANSAAPTSAPAQSTSRPGMSSRDASRARREAMSQGGKAAVASSDRTRSDEIGTTTPAPAATATSAPAATETKRDCGCNGDKKNYQNNESTVMSSTAAMSSSRVKSGVSQSSTRAASLARRQAMSSKGNADKEQARTVPTGPGRHRKAGAAQDATWKVGANDTASGQTVTGTMVDRTEDVTGNEASTCRQITGTDYMGADVFKEFCQSDVQPAPNRVSVTSTSSGNSVTGNNVGRGANVTGNEPGTCRKVTGVEYVSADQSDLYCNSRITSSQSGFDQTTGDKAVTGSVVGRFNKVTGNESGSDKQLTGTTYMRGGQNTAPSKVKVSQTLRGGSITGQHVGRSKMVTGDEPGACRNVTGDDYIGSEQFSEFCESTPVAFDQKVGVSGTLMGKSVTGTMTDRGDKVTGNEAGVCKALTGTPYSGVAQTEAFCTSDEKHMAMARARKGATNVGPAMTGSQPGIDGVMTGAQKGACEPVTGTPYVGVDQAANACAATAASSGSMAGQPWGQFSVESPAKAAHITGSQYEGGRITGSFGMAEGMVTGTEEARFGGGNSAQSKTLYQPTTMVEGRVKSRITGEGQDAGQKITGDDWDRGSHVTGTEGASAAVRNPTLRGAMGSMAVANKRNEQLPTPTSKVTGSSGNTEVGSLITYSGGARG